MEQISDFFLDYYEGATTFNIILEAIVFIFGILSVYYSKKENILVYPTGLIATVNWARKKDGEPVVPITRTNAKEKLVGFGMFLLTMIVTYAVYRAFDYEIKTANYFDIFTSGVFFTAMWYMAIKKLENWTLWIFADLITVPLYAYRGLGMLSLQYVIFTILAIQGYLVWKRNLGSHVDS